MRTRKHITAAVLVMAAALLAGCGDYSPTTPRGGYPGAMPPVVTAVRLSLEANPIEEHQEILASAQALDQYGAPIGGGAAAYTSSEEIVAVVGPTSGLIFAISPGTTEITATIDGKSDRRTLTVFKSPIRINEIEPNGDGPGGWVELFNPTTAAIDVSGWTVTASDVFRPFVLPAGATIPAGGVFVIDEERFPAGLQSVDAVHLFSRFGVQVDQYVWTTDPATTYGRCPDGTGDFVTTTAPTRAAANSCP